jgi:uncharacterized membrane protein YccC
MMGFSSLALGLVRIGHGARIAVPDWIGGVVPGWLAEVVRPKKAPFPWGTMARSVLAVWGPFAVAFATGRRDLALLPAMGGLLSVTIDNGGPYWDRVRRIGTAAVCGGAPGLFIGTLIHGRGWVAVGVVVIIAGVSAILARLGGVGSVTGLQLFIFSTLGLGPFGELRPWWHTALEWGAGVAWSLLLITPGYLLAPRSAERKAVADVYHAIAADLRAIGTPASPSARQAATDALNTAYDAMLTRRAAASGGRSRRDMHLMAVLNVSHQLAEAAGALRATHERPPPWISDTVDRLGDAVLADRGPGSGVLGSGVLGSGVLGSGVLGSGVLGSGVLGSGVLRTGGRSGQRRGAARDIRSANGDGALPMIPPQWSAVPGALALREGMVALARVISGSWALPTAPAGTGGIGNSGNSGGIGGIGERLHERLTHLAEQLLAGRIAWEFTLRLMLCTGVAAVLSEVLPLQRSYWLVLTVGIILKPDFGSVFARAVQRGIGTMIGAVLGAAILAVVPYGPWLLLPFGVLAALLPYAKARSFGLVAVFLTPLVVLLIDLLDTAGWHLAEARLIDTALACAVVLLVGYAPWPSAWQAHLPGQFADTVRAVCAYMDEALAAAPAKPAASGTDPGQGGGGPGAGRPGGPPGQRSRLRRRTFRALSNLRAEFQRTMSEPAAVSRRASAWWPAVVGLEDVMDAVTATVVAISRGAAVPEPSAVHHLTGALRAVADAIETGSTPSATVPAALPADPQLQPVTVAVSSVLAVLTHGETRQPGEPPELSS